MWESSSCVQARTWAWGELAWSCLWGGPLYLSRWAQLSCVLISPKGTLPVSASALLFILLFVHGASFPGGLVKFFPDFSFYLESYPFWEIRFIPQPEMIPSSSEHFIWHLIRYCLRIFFLLSQYIFFFFGHLEQRGGLLSCFYRPNYKILEGQHLKYLHCFLSGH